MTGLRAPAAVCGLHNGGVVAHDGTRDLGKVSVKNFVFVGGFGCADDLVDQVDGSSHMHIYILEYLILGVLLLHVHVYTRARMRTYSYACTCMHNDQ